MADDRFANFNPAPLDQSGFDRFARRSGGALTGGAQGAVVGFLATPVMGMLAGAGLAVAAVALAGVAVAAFSSLTVIGAVTGFVGTAGLGAALIGGAAGLFGGLGVASVGGVLGGLYGGFRGVSSEGQKIGLDQSYYNVAMAEAVSRGAAQGQATAYVAANATPQPIREEALAARKDIPVMEEAPRTALADKVATMNLADSTVVAKDSVSLEGKKEVTLSKADQLAVAAANQNGQSMAHAV